MKKKEKGCCMGPRRKGFHAAAFCVVRTGEACSWGKGQADMTGLEVFAA